MTSTDIAADMQEIMNRQSPVREHFSNVASTLADVASEADAAGRRDISDSVDSALERMVEIVRE